MTLIKILVILVFFGLFWITIYEISALTTIGKNKTFIVRHTNQTTNQTTNLNHQSDQPDRVDRVDQVDQVDRDQVDHHGLQSVNYSELMSIQKELRRELLLTHDRLGEISFDSEKEKLFIAEIEMNIINKTFNNAKLELSESKQRYKESIEESVKFQTNKGTSKTHSQFQSAAFKVEKLERHFMEHLEKIDRIKTLLLEYERLAQKKSKLLIEYSQNVEILAKLKTKNV